MARAKPDSPSKEFMPTSPARKEGTKSVKPIDADDADGNDSEWSDADVESNGDVQSQYSLARSFKDEEHAIFTVSAHIHIRTTCNIRLKMRFVD